KISFYDREIETLDRERLRELQDERLRALMVELRTNRFYKEKLRAAGLEAEDIRSADDLAKLPFTTKSELVEEQRGDPPFGRLLTYPISRYRYYHQTSGTTGQPLRWVDTEETWEWFLSCWGYVYRAAGVTEEDTVFCAFSFGPYISHWTAISAAWRVGAMCIAGGGMNSEQRLRAIIDNRATVIVCTPTYALHLAEVARASRIDLRSSAVRRGIHAGEPGASLPNVKRVIESEWGITCFDHAGATEAGAWAFDCEAQTGAIHINEAEFIFEVIDPESLDTLGEGERGELVITNPGRGAMPVLRYRTGDLVELTTEPCPCGRSFARIKGGVLGRADDMMIVRGVNIYPGAIDDLMRGIPGVVEYEVVIRRIAGMDDLLIKTESDAGVSFEEIERSIQSGFRQRFSIRVGIERAATGSLPRYKFKARRYKREDS
ncbi:MAG TPA: AMP-binding protein, partial [Blastocatellia bacterium]|nr:AMP-binding protein [Blastocatellia bacterium]